MTSMDIPLRLPTELSRQPKRLGVLARLWRYCVPPLTVEGALERISKATEVARDGIDSSETPEGRLAVERQLHDALGRYSHSTAVHFMPSCSIRRKPAIHFMLAPGKPAALVVKTWSPDVSGNRAVVAKIFKIPAQNAGDFVSELETLFSGGRDSLPASPITVFP